MECSCNLRGLHYFKKVLYIRIMKQFTPINCFLLPMCERIVTQLKTLNLPRLSQLPLTACGLISMQRTRDGFARKIQKMWRLWAIPSALPLSRATLANVEMESANVNKRTAPTKSQKTKQNQKNQGTFCTFFNF